MRLRFLLCSCLHSPFKPSMLHPEHLFCSSTYSSIGTDLTARVVSMPGLPPQPHTWRPLPRRKLWPWGQHSPPGPLPCRMGTSALVYPVLAQCCLGAASPLGELSWQGQAENITLGNLSSSFFHLNRIPKVLHKFDNSDLRVTSKPTRRRMEEA